MVDERALAAIAALQDGLFGRADCRSAGMSNKVLARRVKQEQYLERHPGVFQAATSPWTFQAQERAALMAAGPLAMLSHDSAALRWKLLTDIKDAEVWITLPFKHPYLRLEGVNVVRSRHVKGIRRSREGWPLSQPARTWVDLGRSRTAEQLEGALATGLQRKIMTLAEINRALDQSHHKAGTELVRQVLPHFDEAWESSLSAQFARLMLAAAISLVPGHKIRDRSSGDILAILDFADVERRIAFEVDGWYYHGSKIQQQADKKRDRMLLRLGWVTVRFTTDDILHHPERVVAEVRALLMARAA
jgi:very-short-patch-repair endonuclease